MDPVPFSPVHNEQFFPAVSGTVFANNCMKI